MESFNRSIRTPRTVLAMDHFRFFNMYFFFLGFFLLVNINEISGGLTSRGPKPDVKLSVIPLESNKTFNLKFNVHVEPPRFYEKSFVIREIREDDFVTKEIGARTVHRRELAWNKARSICVEEGGHMMSIRSMPEEPIVLEFMRRASNVKEIWIGIHDQFEEGNGDWVTLLDESSKQIGWSSWLGMCRNGMEIGRTQRDADFGGSCPNSWNVPNCYDCPNSSNCPNCWHCPNCSNCPNCSSCPNCRSSQNCLKCPNSMNCLNCSNSPNCLNCPNCQDRPNCSNC